MPHRSIAPTDPEDETDLVRSFVRHLAAQMQRQGEIPPDVSQTELYREAEQYVTRITEALRKSPMYPHWKSTNHLKEHIRQLVKQTLAASAQSTPGRGQRPNFVCSRRHRPDDFTQVETSELRRHRLCQRGRHVPLCPLQENRGARRGTSLRNNPRAVHAIRTRRGQRS